MWRSNQLSYRTVSPSFSSVPETPRRGTVGFFFQGKISHLTDVLLYTNSSCSKERSYVATIPHRLGRLFLVFHRHHLPFVSRRHSRKEVFQPHLPVRLPCYDLAPITGFTLGRSSRSRASGTPGFHGLTGGVYKARERIHRAMADARLLANPASWSRVADSSPN